MRTGKRQDLNPLERRLQLDTADLFFGSRKNPPLLRKDWRAWHTPNEGSRNIVAGANLKRMGMLAGIPDWVIVSPDGKVYFLELKRVGEKLTKEQDEFRMWCVANGIPYAVAHSLTDVIRACQFWGAVDPKIKLT